MIGGLSGVLFFVAIYPPIFFPVGIIALPAPVAPGYIRSPLKPSRQTFLASRGAPFTSAVLLPFCRCPLPAARAILYHYADYTAARIIDRNSGALFIGVK
jgi:hypothetical protein